MVYVSDKIYAGNIQFTQPPLLTCDVIQNVKLINPSVPIIQLLHYTVFT
jgi:hypothetical protein